MMSNVELKARGKEAFLKNYWRYVLVCLILGLLTRAEARSSSENANTDRTMAGEIIHRIINFEPVELVAFMGVVISSLVLVIVIAVLVEMFIKNPIRVGTYRFMIKGSRGQEAELKDVFSAYKDGYFANTFITMFLNDLYVFLWSLLFIIPGIVKAYSYRMVPFILAENPGMPANEVITRSREMMDGQKWRAFVLDISFIGWYILSLITAGIVGLFYSDPYKRATDAELYEAIRMGR